MNQGNEGVGPTQKRQTFGSLLRYYRSTYGERFRRKYPDVPRITLTVTATALLNCMADSDYRLTSGAYTQIENDASLPRDPQAFLDAVAKCLLIDEQQEYDRLRRQLAFDIVAARAGEDIAKWTVGLPSSPASPGDQIA